MTQQEYLQQNLAGFENDQFAKEKMKSIVEENNIDVIIETGTYLGATTKHFAEWAPQVHTIEVERKHYDQAAKNLKRVSNVFMYFGNSSEILPGILLSLKERIKSSEDQVNIFIFLDAHWASYNPLIDELAVIKYSGFKPIIAIHDFKVPGHPELGFDTYGGQDYDWDWIKESVESIYGVDGYTVYYNEQATGAKRGIIYIEPKK